MERVSKSYLNRKLRVGKIDSALLFLSSSVGIMFAVVRSVTGDPVSLLYSSPLLFLGMVLPFYIGYWRGAVVRPSAIDRYRGWIFFFVGIGYYVFNLTTVWLTNIGELSKLGGQTIGSFVLAGSALIVFVVAGRKFEKSFFRTVRYQKTKLTKECVRRTIFAAFLFGTAFSILVSLLSSGYYGYESWELLAVIGGFGVYTFMLSERDLRMANSNYREETVMGRLHGRGFSENWGWGIALAGTLAVVASELLVRYKVIGAWEYLIGSLSGVVGLLLGVVIARLLGTRTRWVPE